MILPVPECLKDPLPFISNGHPVRDGKRVPVMSPTSRRQIGEAVIPSPEQVDQAVASAKVASKQWAGTTGAYRAEVLTKVADIFKAHAEELARLDAIEIGKPISGSRFSDVPLSLEALRYFAGRAMDIRGVSVEVGDPDVVHRQRLEPYGVVLEVLPWNGPLWTGVQRFAAIIAAGNAAILKPASWALSSWARLGELLAGELPPGLLTVLPGPGGSVGAQLIDHPDVSMVSLTGGTETGQRVLASTAGSLKRVSLELGGKNPNLVLPNADLALAARWSAMGAFSNSGQVCVCGSRILVHESVADEFVSMVVANAAAMSQGNPLDEATQLGPVVSEQQFNSIWTYIDQATSDGSGRLVAGGVRYTAGPLSQGYFIPPTVFVDVAPSCALFKEEIFGPVLSVTTFSDLDDAIRLANDTSYGLSAGVFSNDIHDANYVADRLQAGQVYINQWFSPGVLQAPSEGYKESGIGGVGMEKYQQVKNVFTRITRGA